MEVPHIQSICFLNYKADYNMRINTWYISSFVISLVVNNLGLDFKQDMKTKLASYGKNQAAAVEVMTAAGWK